MSIPTIDVNLHRCTYLEGKESPEFHFSDLCNTQPILITCPIPRSGTFTVARGECAAPCPGEWTSPSPSGPNYHGHHSNCPARPVRVSCSISGSTWGESEVTDVETGPAHPTQPVMAEMQLLLVARERWALAKALVLGDRIGKATPLRPRHVGLVVQRDAVFAALADMAQAEGKQAEAYSRAVTAMGPIKAMRGGGERPSSFVLAAYVERLIEQIGALP